MRHDSCPAPESYLRRIDDTVSFFRSVTTAVPEIAIVLGSGLGGLSDQIEKRRIVTFPEIPALLPADFTSAVAGHRREFIFGELAGRAVVAQSGRLHLYEGLSAADVALPVRALAKLGVKNFLITNAAGGINPEFKPGDVMFLTNHIGFGIEDPSLGVTHPELGSRFYDVTYPYDEELITLGIEESAKAGLRAHRGCYVMTPGPRYETASEIAILALQGKLLRDAGKSDLAPSAVGMSTVPEVNALRNLHQLSPLRIAALSLITNLGAGISPHPLTHAEVQQAGEAASKKLQMMARGFVARL